MQDGCAVIKVGNGESLGALAIVSGLEGSRAGPGTSLKQWFEFLQEIQQSEAGEEWSKRAALAMAFNLKEALNVALVI